MLSTNELSGLAARSLISLKNDHVSKDFIQDWKF